MVRIFSLVLLVSALFVTPTAPAAALTIWKDPGGRIGTYVDKYRTLANSTERVEIAGPCVSACTLVTAFIPRNRICVTRNAVLGFHAAWDYGEGGTQVTSDGGTRLLMSLYPSAVKSWIARRGGLRTEVIWLSGKSLQHLYPLCSEP